MKKLLLTLFGVLFLISLSLSQEADSLLLADFEDEAAGLGRWTNGWGDAFSELLWIEDPIGESVGVLELFISGTGNAAFSTTDFFIIVDGDTATGLAVDVMIFEDFREKFTEEMAQSLNIGLTRLNFDDIILCSIKTVDNISAGDSFAVPHDLKPSFYEHFLNLCADSSIPWAV